MEEKLCVENGRWGFAQKACQGGVPYITFMNQCQWSVEKIIKRQASAVLNAAKGKRLFLLCGNMG